MGHTKSKDSAGNDNNDNMKVKNRRVDAAAVYGCVRIVAK